MTSIAHAASVLRPAGLRAADPEDTALAALAACHARIRRFAGLAITLADRPDAPAAERVEAAAAVVRYFTIALPQHAADEDLGIAPRLRGRDAAVDAALDAMTAEHVAHAAVLAPVLAACRAIVETPAAPPPSRFAADAAALAAALEAHLAAEEAIVFPALAALPAADLAALRVEMRDRRNP